MNRRQMVLGVLKEAPGTQMDSQQVLDRLQAGYLGVEFTREQVSNSLSDLATWGEITRVSRGLYTYEFKAEDTPKMAKTLREGGRIFEGSVSDALADGETADHKYFTQVGVAKNGDKILTNDATGETYRATPL